MFPNGPSLNSIVLFNHMEAVRAESPALKRLLPIKNNGQQKKNFLKMRKLVFS